MSPHARNPHQNTKNLHIWWKSPSIYNDRILAHYNLYIAPTIRLPYAKVLTSQLLLTIFRNTIESALFDRQHHLITINRFFIRNKEKNAGFMVCKDCKTALDDLEIQDPTPIEGKQHMMLSEDLAYSILELKSFWCADCDKQLFKWYSRSECPSCKNRQ